ncbi:murein L,D-transpeptidase [Liberibacter sp. Z1]|nr:murein L,D-transpeptidase [Candidatus Liberibacter sp.]
MHKKGTHEYSPSLIRIFKQENILEIWKQTSEKTYVKIKSYKICAWSGKLGPKIENGDKQSPEGFYHIQWENLNPYSRYYLSMNIGFPNSFDKTNLRTGVDIMIHGDCASSGCYSIRNKSMREIYGIVRDSFRGGQSHLQIQIFPFRMTERNMQRYRNNPNYPFWKNLQIGYNYFETNRKEPVVRVYEKQYVFFHNNNPNGEDIDY